MSRQENLTNWLAQCPSLATLWNISAEPQDGANVIFPTGSSRKRNISDGVDVTGWYQSEIQPLPSVYEDYQINCYKRVFGNENEWNIMKLEEVENVIAWIEKQDEAQNFPDIGESVVSVETFPFVPQIRGIDPNTGMVCYYITLRVTYVNMAKGRSFECQT